MITQFSGLNQEEADLMMDAIPLVTVLIAGADGNIDNEEKEWAAKLTKIRSYNNPEAWNDFYKAVGENYSEKLDKLISSLPSDTEARNTAISERLAVLNDLLPKIDQHAAHSFYKGLTTFAEHVAKASGGFLRIGAISRAEEKWIDLPMITPVAEPEEEA